MKRLFAFVFALSLAAAVYSTSAQIIRGVDSGNKVRHVQVDSTGAVKITPWNASGALWSAGDTSLASTASISLYPCFGLGGSHIHSALYRTGNNCTGKCNGFFIYSDKAVRIKFFGSSLIDTSGFSLPALGTLNASVEVDSVTVANWQGTAAAITWGFSK